MYICKGNLTPKIKIVLKVEGGFEGNKSLGPMHIFTVNLAPVRNFGDFRHFKVPFKSDFLGNLATRYIFEKLLLALKPLKYIRPNGCF